MGDSGAEPSSSWRVVLGAFADASRDDGGPSAAAAAGGPDGGAPVAVASSSSSSSPAARILGTSYFATPRLLDSASSSSGTGAARRSSSSALMGLNKDGRVLMEDRKGPLDHFRPRSLALSTTRVAAIQLSTALSGFFTDQLASEQEIESRVDAGEISAREADDANEEWEEREWKVRTDALPEKVGRALLRFHACTAVMRLYEYVAARYLLKLEGGGPALLEGGGGGGSAGPPARRAAAEAMDRLTRDPYRASLRASQLLRGSEHAPGRVVTADGIETSTSRELARRTFATCAWANAIPFLAELTVQHAALIYGYGTYYVARRRRRRTRAKDEEGDGGGDGGGEDAEEGGPEREPGGDGPPSDEEDGTAYALSFLFRSSRLTIARSMSWIAASAGGAVGSVVCPGWGTVFGIQIGDTVLGALID
ncbi:hypothetical protein ACHAWF_003331 [Thalassiosira exigua]